MPELFVFRLQSAPLEMDQPDGLACSPMVCEYRQAPLPPLVSVTLHRSFVTAASSASDSAMRAVSSSALKSPLSSASHRASSPPTHFLVSAALPSGSCTTCCSSSLIHVVNQGSKLLPQGLTRRFSLISSNRGSCASSERRSLAFAESGTASCDAIGSTHRPFHPTSFASFQSRQEYQLTRLRYSAISLP